LYGIGKRPSLNAIAIRPTIARDNSDFGQHVGEQLTKRLSLFIRWQGIGIHARNSIRPRPSPASFAADGKGGFT
jgi:hypothetical protein